MLNTGDPAPAFELSDDTGQARTLDSLLADGPIVLYFYPADFTPMCTAEACMFRDAHAELADKGVRVVGVSPQSVGSHAKFKAKHALPFPLLSDPGKAMIRAYGANGPLGFGTRRLTYLIGADGVVLDRVAADLGLGKHRAFVQAALDAAGSAGVDAEAPKE